MLGVAEGMEGEHTGTDSEGTVFFEKTVLTQPANIPKYFGGPYHMPFTIPGTGDTKSLLSRTLHLGDGRGTLRLLSQRYNIMRHRKC